MGARTEKKPKAAPKAAPKPKINIIAAMRNEIIQSQLAIAKKVGISITPPAKPAAPKDPKVKKLIDFLATKPFGCNTEKAIEFAEILHGSEIRKYIPVQNSNDNDEDDPKRNFIIPGTIYHKGSEVLVVTRRDSDGDVIDNTVNNTSGDELLMEDTNHISDVMDRSSLIIPTLTEKVIKETVAKYSDLTVTQIYTMLQLIKKESK